MYNFSIANYTPTVISFSLLIAGLILYLVYYFERKFSYWDKYGVPQVRPVWFFGNIMDQVLLRSPAVFVEQDIYNKLSGHKLGGFYSMSKPILMLRDPELIRICLIKSFGHFHDRDIPFDPKDDPLSESLFVQRGQRWRAVRHKKAPAFSTSKLRTTVDALQVCVQELDDFLTAAIAAGSSGGLMNLTELMAKFAVDLMASFTFGIQCNTLRNGHSEFKRIGRDVFKGNNQSLFWSLVQLARPKLVSVDRSAQKQDQEWFMSLMREEATKRAMDREKRTDYFQFILNLQADELKKMQSSSHREESGDSDDSPVLTDIAVAASMYSQITLAPTPIAHFFTHCLYELALNPAVFQKMRDEVDSVKKEYDDILNYDALRKLEYMEMVISETLRKHPSFPSLNRICTEPFQIPGTSIIIKEGTSIFVPTYALHHDPDYFPEPETFWPERFSKENAGSIKPGSFLAFGIGPRGCMAERFSRFEIKSVLALVVSKFTLHPTEKTMIPLAYDCRGLGLSPKEDIWVQFKMRQVT